MEHFGHSAGWQEMPYYPGGRRFGVVGLGPIGLLAAQVALSRGASLVTGCDTSKLPVRIAREVGLEETIQGNSTALLL